MLGGCGTGVLGEVARFYVFERLKRFQATRLWSLDRGRVHITGDRPRSESIDTAPEADTHTDTPVPQNTEHPTPAVFDAQSFYQTIIDNNLFRPLGWTPPRPTEPYRLIGTILPRSANTPPKAIIQTTADDRTYIVTPGESLDASTEVVLIEGKQEVSDVCHSRHRSAVVNAAGAIR